MGNEENSSVVLSQDIRDEMSDAGEMLAQEKFSDFVNDHGANIEGRKWNLLDWLESRDMRIEKDDIAKDVLKTFYRRSRELGYKPEEILGEPQIPLRHRQFLAKKFSKAVPAM